MNDNTIDDKKYMHIAIELAKKGLGKVNPNPLVGAVIVKNGNIIGEGYHQKYGQPHAEPNAIKNAIENGKDTQNATIYVTLEPCCHQGKTPPCTNAIIESGIKRVVVGCLDPNDLVKGNGIAILKEAGIDTTVGMLEKECENLNEVFFHYIQNKTPFVAMKYAMTIDGKIATASGKSKWITGENSRAIVQEYRNKYSGIMVGLGTILADDPSLTCRIDDGRNPIRIVCDTNLKTPLSSNIIQTAKDVRTIIATCTKENHKPYLDLNCEIIVVSKNSNGYVDLNELMQKLGNIGIDSILLEGGSELNFSALEAGIVQKIMTFISAKIFGGKNAKTPIGGTGLQEIANAINLKNIEITQIDKNDILIEGRL